MYMTISLAIVKGICVKICKKKTKETHVTFTNSMHKASKTLVTKALHSLYNVSTV